MTRLLKYDLETTWTISGNTDESRDHIYKQKMKETTYKRRNQSL